MRSVRLIKTHPCDGGLSPRVRHRLDVTWTGQHHIKINSHPLEAMTGRQRPSTTQQGPRTPFARESHDIHDIIHNPETP